MITVFDIEMSQCKKMFFAIFFRFFSNKLFVCYTARFLKVELELEKYFCCAVITLKKYFLLYIKMFLLKT